MRYKDNMTIRDKKGRFVKGSKFIHTKKHNTKVGETRKRLFKEGKLKIIKKKNSNKKASKSLKKWWKENKDSDIVRKRNKKISKKRKGKKLPNNHPFKRGGFSGKYHTEKARKKIGENSYTKGKPNKWGEHTEKAKKKIGFANKGEKSHLWKGGITPLNIKIRELREYKNWRKKVFEIYNYTCQNCGKKGRGLNAHHIKPFYKIRDENKIKTVKQAIKCKELWNINNGIILCETCHNLIGEKINQYTIKKLRKMNNKLNKTGGKKDEC